MAAHSTPNYATTGAGADASDDAGLAQWRRDNAIFFDDDGDGSDPVGTRYQISPEEK